MSVPPPHPIDRQVQAFSDQELDEKMKSLKDKQGCAAFVCAALFFLTGLGVFLVVAIIHPLALPSGLSDLIGCLGFNGLIFLTILVFLGSGDWAYESQMLTLRVEKSRRESDARVRQWRKEQAQQEKEEQSRREEADRERQKVRQKVEQSARDAGLPARIDLKVIIGPPLFVQAVHRVLNELKDKAPHRYQEMLEKLPKAEHKPEFKRQFFGRSDGIFAIDGSNYKLLRFVLLHETGHCVFNHNHANYLSTEEKERQATNYANNVLAELHCPLRIIGPPEFCRLVHELLSELRTKANKRYCEVIRFLPKAEYTPAISPHQGHPDGCFFLDGVPYERFRFVLLRETGRNLFGKVKGDWHTQTANMYAQKVIQELLSS